MGTQRKNSEKMDTQNIIKQSRVSMKRTLNGLGKTLPLMLLPDCTSLSAQQLTTQSEITSNITNKEKEWKMGSHAYGCTALQVFFVWVVTLVLSSCGGGSESAQPPTSVLIGSMTTAQITSFVPDNSAMSPTYDVKAYKVSYNTTTPTGGTTTASGLLLIPQKAEGAVSPLFSLQHGTIASQLEAPSNASLKTIVSYDVAAGLASASFGFVVAMPDYLGYGDSQSIFHPYIQADSLATASIDMLRASQSVMRVLGVATNGQLFLAGYSEGGYATLAAQKEIETNLASEFTITASEPGAGPYNLSGTTDAVMATSDLAGITDPTYLAFVIDAYQTYYDPSGSLDTYFTSSTLDCVNSYFSNGWYGSNNFGYFDSCIDSTTTASILNSSFIADYNSNNANVDIIKQALASNNIYDWKPQVPTRLYYSPYDEAVPQANTTTAFDTMNANGSTTVETATCDITTAFSVHNACIGPYFIDVASYFANYVTVTDL